MTDLDDGAPIRPDPDAERDLTFDPAAKNQPAEGGRDEAGDDDGGDVAGDVRAEGGAQGAGGEPRD